MPGGKAEAKRAKADAKEQKTLTKAAAKAEKKKEAARRKLTKEKKKKPPGKGKKKGAAGGVAPEGEEVTFFDASLSPGEFEHDAMAPRRARTSFQARCKAEQEAESTHPPSLAYDVPEWFDYTKPTSENYKLDDHTSFYGDFAHIREDIDYGYHNNYTEERQLWQDTVVHSVVFKTAPQASPWIVYTCGPMGAGKGYALSWMSDNKYFPLENIVHIDPDHFKAVMTEWEGYTERDSGTAGSMCHQETAFIQELAQEVALSKAQNLWVDGSLRNGKWFQRVFADIRERYPRYRIAIFYVYADEKLIRERVKQREIKTGRGVPEAELLDSLQAPDRSLGMLVSHVDFIARINNNGAIPYLTTFESVDTSGCWTSISSRFSRVQAAPTEFPESLAPLWLTSFAVTHGHFEWPEGLLDTITDVKTKGSHEIKIVNALYEEGTSMGNLAAHMPNLILRLSPAHSVDLDEETRKAVGIPPTARFYAHCSGLDLVASNRAQNRWVSAAKAVQGKEDTGTMVVTHRMLMLTSSRGLRRLGVDEDDAMSSFVTGGGFLYFDKSRSVCGATAHDKNPTKESAVLQFGRGTLLNEAQSTVLVGKIKHRLVRVTQAFVLAKGAWRYAFLLPGESFGSLFRNPFGGFVYEFGEDEGNRCRFFPILSDVV